MNTETGRTYEIMRGPSKDNIVDAFKYAFSGVHVPLKFAISGGYTMPKNDPGCACIALPVSDFRIIGISYEDESGYNLNLRGYCNASLSSFSPEAEKERYFFTAFYNSKKREGTITISKLC